VGTLLRGRVWNPVNGAVVVMGYLSMPTQMPPASWQSLQLVVNPAWIIAEDGAGLRKPVAPNVAVAFAETSPAGTLPTWQLSHEAVVGMCEVGPAGEVAGITMILVTPLKLPPVMVGP
jgi:hypothetical protein